MSVKQQRIQIVVSAAIKKRVKIMADRHKRSAQQEAAYLLEAGLAAAEAGSGK